MSKKSLIVYSALLVLGSASLAFEQSAHAFNPGNMMNPSKWFGGNNRDRYDDDYYYDRYRYGRGYGYGGPYGYGGYPGYGYGGYPGYGYGGYPGYGAPGYNQQKNETPLPPIPQ